MNFVAIAPLLVIDTPYYSHGDSTSTSGREVVASGAGRS